MERANIIAGYLRDWSKFYGIEPLNLATGDYATTGKDLNMIAAHTDGLVLGLGDTESAALADAELHGAECLDLIDFEPITREAASYVSRGGDCRGLVLSETGFSLRQSSRK